MRLTPKQIKAISKIDHLSKMAVDNARRGKMERLYYTQGFHVGLALAWSLEAESLAREVGLASDSRLHRVTLKEAAGWMR